uniref:Cell cycle checkpoint protein RAD1 n=1 Tax=Steinernema glaseri TaxID=37863 RepID=A0A1I7ZC86_9BILA
MMYLCDFDAVDHVLVMSFPHAYSAHVGVSRASADADDHVANVSSTAPGCLEDMDDSVLALQHAYAPRNVFTGRPLLKFEKDNAMRDFYPLIKAMEFRKFCLFIANSEGLSIVVDDESYQQAVTRIQADNFKEWYIKPDVDEWYIKPDVDVVEFRILISDLLESLTVFGRDDPTSIVCTYPFEGAEVVFEKRKEHVYVTFEVKTHFLSTKLDFGFSDEDVECRIMVNLKPDIIHDIIKDLDKSAQTVLLKITNDSLQFSTSGELGKIKVAIPITSEIIDELTLAGHDIALRYKISLMQRMVQALHSCDRVSIRIDTRGVFCAQFIASQMNMMNNYIEYFIVPDAGTSSSDEADDIDVNE